MVGYDDSNNALTLGDDSSLKIGEYELQYSSGNDRFEIEHPNGDQSYVPRNTSGSLIPEGLARTVGNGKALADDGVRYDTVQDAVNNASGWVFVGPGTFNENVTISTAGLTLEGSGYDTLIDGGTSGNGVRVDASSVTVQNISVQTTTGAGNLGDGVLIGSDAENVVVQKVTVRESDRYGIYITSTNGSHRISHCVVSVTDQRGMQIESEKTVITNCQVSMSSNQDAIFVNANDCIAVNNTVENGDDGVYVANSGADSVIAGNRIIGAGRYGIIVTTPDVIVANNRVSDSGTNDIQDDATGTVLDDNLTGPSN